MHDLVIRGGTVVDGTGAPARTADVAIDGGKISLVGKAGAARREIAADGLLVTPGFVDVHTHYDAQATWDPYLTPSGWHGVTTAVMGNCGVGFAPARPDKHDWLIGLMEGVEDIPGAALAEGIDWQWESFGEYLDALERLPRVLDIGTQIPHGALRAYVMGERGANNESATADDVQAMQSMVAEALRKGALGFSTSRTMIHKSKDGIPVPGTFAPKDELMGIAKALADTNRGVFQIACDHLAVPNELVWMEEVAKFTKRPVCFNLSQTDFSPQLWRDVAATLQRMHDQGLPVGAQVAGRPIGIVMAWDLTAHPFAGCPAWREIADLSRDERRSRLRDPAVRARMISEEPVGLGMFEQYVSRFFDKMWIVEGDVDYEPPAEASIAAIAARTGIKPAELAYDALCKDDLRGKIYFPLFNYAEKNLDVLHTLHQHPGTFFGLSDAGAHCGAICDGGMPTFMMSFWTRDRKRGPTLPIEHIIRRQTSATAALYGFSDRGTLREGLLGDVNVIDLQNLRQTPPEVVWDLPAGGRRLIQKANGYRATVKRGVVTVENDTFTGELPGRVLRGEA